jgi:hypothetical protein
VILETELIVRESCGASRRPAPEPVPPKEVTLTG